MPDIAHKMTEAEIEALERKIKKEYDLALRDAERKASAYFDKFEEQDLKQLQKLKAGEITVTEYKTWRTNKMLQGKNYNALVNRLAADLSNADKIAMKMVGDALPGVYALNSNFAAYDMCRGTGANLSFDVYDRKTVERLIKDEPELLPAPRVDIPKDLQWNKQHIRSALTQGVLQGESINKIAKRLRNVTDMDRRAAVRNARTAMTGAQNAGRYNRYKEAEEKMGLVFDKVWMSVHDKKTRDSHRDIDGTQVPYNEKFPNELMYPGDPEGKPGEVYNCRCTMKSVYLGKRGEVQNAYGKFKEEGFEEWEQDKIDMRKVVDGKDLTDTWQRRPQKFKFEIEDVINAQGFDGLPKVVDAEEFDKYVRESNFIAQRTYSAPDKQTLETYKNELYNGKWYVDCSTGGAAYGQGMYCAGNYEGKLTDAIKQEMKDYQGQNLNYSGKESVHIVETLTLDKSAKIVDYENIYGEYSGIMRLAEREQIMDDYVNRSLSSLNKDEQIFAKFNLGQSGISWKEVSNAAENIDPQRRTEIMVYINGEKTKAEEYIQKISREMSEKGNKIREKYTDVGSYAASKGYDAIRTSNGTSGADTVILNRTKVILKGEG